MPLVKKTTSTPTTMTNTVPIQGTTKKIAPSVTEETFDEETVNPNAAVFNALSQAKEFAAPDVGTYEAILHTMKILPLGPKGQSIQAIFVLASFDQEGNLYGQTFSRFFKVFEADGETPNHGSMMFWAAMMSKLGYPKDNRGPEAFDEINESQPAISLKITENSNPQFPPNATVLMRLGEDNENIVALREWVENNPF